MNRPWVAALALAVAGCAAPLPQQSSPDDPSSAEIMRAAKARVAARTPEESARIERERIALQERLAAMNANSQPAPSAQAAPPPRRTPPPPEPEVPSTVYGSGFVVTPSQVVTNHHVVDACRAVTVFADGQPIEASVQAFTTGNDLALLKLASNLPTSAPLRALSSLGEEVVVAGYPLYGLLSPDLVVTAGQVSSLAGLGGDPTVVQISAPVQPGNSGGPLIDRTGAVVGVVVAKLDAQRLAKMTGDIAQNINFAVKPELLRLFLDANQVHYRAAVPGKKLDGEDIAKRARGYTVRIVCERLS